MYTSDDSVQTVALPATATVTELILALGVTEAFDLVETLELAGAAGGAPVGAWADNSEGRGGEGERVGTRTLATDHSPSNAGRTEAFHHVTVSRTVHPHEPVGPLAAVWAAEGSVAVEHRLQLRERAAVRRVAHAYRPTGPNGVTHAP